MTVLVERKVQDEALKKTLERIRKRGQRLFKHQLKVKWAEAPHDGWFNFRHFYYIAEIYHLATAFNPIFPFTLRRSRTLFMINKGVSDGSWGKVGINCILYNESLVRIVEEELGRYADEIQAPSVNLTVEEYG